MTRFYKFLLIALFAWGLASSCTSRKDDRLDRAIFTYAISCSGGSLSSCRATCPANCGISTDTSLTNSEYPCIRDCQSSCDSVCDLSSILLLLNSE
ncbi:MAG: hypothetical protein AAF518_02610 [Spirochaetota bacterium]